MVAALFFGLKSAVLAVVLQAVLRVGGKALKNPTMVTIAIVAFIAIFFFGVPFPAIILAAGVLGHIGTRAGSATFRMGAPAGHGVGAPDDIRHAEPSATRVTHPAGSLARIAGLWLALWLVPVIAILALVGPEHTFGQIALFFSEMAVVTFGGAYAVLAYVAQQAVEHYGWLRPGEMLDGLGMAETTPGPLVMVTQFVGFMAAYRHPGSLPPMLAGALGGLLTTWVTFTPCFLWIFLGAPFVEKLRGNTAIAGALAAITAAVVGVILNLGVWFALHTWFLEARHIRASGLSFDVPVLASLDWIALALSIAAIAAIFRFGTGIIATLIACAGASMALHAVGLA